MWEETIILLPDNVHYVFLSATIPNARQFAEWICHLHKQVCVLVCPVEGSKEGCGMPFCLWMLPSPAMWCTRSSDQSPCSTTSTPLGPMGCTSLWMKRSEIWSGECTISEHRVRPPPSLSPPPPPSFFFSSFSSSPLLLLPSLMCPLPLPLQGNFREDNFQTAMSMLQDGGGRAGAKGKQRGSSCFKVVKMIMERQLQPVIVFSFSRRDCEAFALQMSKLDFNTGRRGRDNHEH